MLGEEKAVAACLPLGVHWESKPHGAQELGSRQVQKRKSVPLPCTAFAPAPPPPSCSIYEIQGRTP